MKDKVVSWFMKNVLKPRLEVIDCPGYIWMSPLNIDRKIRQVLFPEAILADIENRLIQEEKSQALYAAGKRVGWRFSNIYRLPRISETSETTFRNRTYFTVQFVGATYASTVEHSIDLQKNQFELEAENYIVCRKNGQGLVMFEGGIAGVWAGMMENPEIEGIQTHCVGRGDQHCKEVAAPCTYLDENGYNYHTYTKLDGLALGENYDLLNAHQQTDYVENSFEDLINTGFFDYTEGVITHADERYFMIQAGLPYLLECTITGADAMQIMFEAAFDHGQTVAEQETGRNMNRFVPEYLSACGWGDTFIKEDNGKIEVQAHLFPWTKFYEDTTFPIYRGLVSGLLSGFSDRKVQLTEVEKDTKGDGFTVIVSE